MGSVAARESCSLDCLSIFWVYEVSVAGDFLGENFSFGWSGFVRKMSSRANGPRTGCVAKFWGACMTAVKRSRSSDFWQPVASSGATVLTAVFRAGPLGMPSFCSCFGFIFLF